MSDSSSINLLLSRLSAETLQELGAERIPYKIGHVLIGLDVIPEHVYFPSAGSVASIICSTSNGATVEAGVVGNEGAASINIVLAADSRTRSDTIVQGEGEFTRITTAMTRRHFQADSAFRDDVLAYTSYYLDQITQHSVCNRLHSIEQRLSKWVLMMRDRVGQENLPLTHDFLAHMLGIHRPGVSIAISALEVDGLISHRRNLITIRDRSGLLTRSCECYEVVRASLERLQTHFSGAS